MRAINHVSNAGILSSRTLALVVLLATVGLSQATPDFTGRWTIAPEEDKADPPGAGPRGNMGSGWGANIVISQDTKQLVVESMLYSRYDLQPQPRFAYALDGSETRNSVMAGRGLQVQTSRARWEGQRLVISTTHSFTDPASGKPLTTEVTQTLSLESPSSLVVDVRRAGALGG